MTKMNDKITYNIYIFHGVQTDGVEHLCPIKNWIKLGLVP